MNADNRVARSGPLWWMVALGIAALALPSPAAEGHALLLSPAPRDQQDGYKDPPRAPPGTGAPCGIGRMTGQPVTTTPTLTPGQPFTVTWRETVDHPGCFVIDFAEANDANFTVLGVKSHANPPKATTPRDWSVGVTVPNVSCAACTLRLRQLMLATDLTDAQCPPSTIPAGATYYSCANVQLGSAAPPDAATGTVDSGSTTPSGAGSNASGGCSTGGDAGRDSAPTPLFLLAALLPLLLATARAPRRRRR